MGTSSRNMRVLIVHNRYARRGGEDRVVEAEAALLRSAGHHVALLEPRSADLTLPRAGLELALLACNPLAAALLRARAAEERPDVVHVHNLFPRLGPSILIEARRLGLPVVMTLHNYRWLCPQATFVRDGQDCRLCADGDLAHAVRHACLHGSRAVTGLYAFALAVARGGGWPYRLADRLVCVSAAQRNEYVKAGWPAERLVVKGHFVEEPCALATGPGEGVLFAGRLSVEKGPQILVEAWRRLHREDSWLSLAGEGPLVEGLRAEPVPGLRWLGFLGSSALAAAMATHACVAIPSICEEAFGLTAIEAMSLGRPVVASAIGALPELIRDGETGLLARPGDADDLASKLGWMLDHPVERQAMGRRARAWAAERFSPGPALVALESLYREAIRIVAERATSDSRSAARSTL